MFGKPLLFYFLSFYQCCIVVNFERNLWFWFLVFECCFNNGEKVKGILEVFCFQKIFLLSSFEF
jgi:hypothetical protein